MADHDTSFRWTYWSVKETKEKLLELIAVLDAAVFPIGWRTVAQDELSSETIPMIPSPDDIAFYRLSAKPGWSSVTLAIELKRESELHGGQMLATFPKSPTERSETRFPGMDVDRFLDEGLLPAAAKVGVTVRKGTVADIFFDELPWEVQHSLSAFDNGSRKQHPLNRAESAAWQAFVIAAYRGPDNASYELLVEWLVAHRWSTQHAMELRDRFFDQFQLLSRYRETLVVA